jgi:hypothetical protein
MLFFLLPSPYASCATATSGSGHQPGMIVRHRRNLRQRRSLSTASLIAKKIFEASTDDSNAQPARKAIHTTEQQQMMLESSRISICAMDAQCETTLASSSMSVSYYRSNSNTDVLESDNIASI